jgi:hypothetical protein
VYLTIGEAVLLILKRATSLHLLNLLSPPSALTQAELEYRGANIDLKIQQHLEASSKKHSVKDFIMATDIGSFILASVEIISHKACRIHTSGPFNSISVFSQYIWAKKNR